MPPLNPNLVIHLVRIRACPGSDSEPSLKSRTYHLVRNPNSPCTVHTIQVLVFSTVPRAQEDAALGLCHAGLDTLKLTPARSDRPPGLDQPEITEQFTFSFLAVLAHDIAHHHVTYAVARTWPWTRFQFELGALRSNTSLTCTPSMRHSSSADARRVPGHGRSSARYIRVTQLKQAGSQRLGDVSARSEIGTRQRAATARCVGQPSAIGDVTQPQPWRTPFVAQPSGVSDWLPVYAWALPHAG